MTHLDVVVSPPAFVWDPNSTLTHVTFDLTHVTFENGSLVMNIFLMNFFLLTFGIATDRQAEDDA